MSEEEKDQSPKQEEIKKAEPVSPQEVTDKTSLNQEAEGEKTAKHGNEENAEHKCSDMKCGEGKCGHGDEEGTEEVE